MSIKTKKIEIILASASPRRHHLFNQMGIDFNVSPADIEEHVDSDLSPDEIVQDLARQKGEVVAKQFSNSVIISADTIVTFNGEILGKPSSKDEAEAMLRKLSGNEHTVYSGVYVALTADGKITDHITLFERTNVIFSTLEDSEISRYVDSGSPMDKAGAYGIQDDAGALFVESIRGDYYNVVGFPMNAFYQTLKTKKQLLFKLIFES